MQNSEDQRVPKSHAPAQPGDYTWGTEQGLGSKRGTVSFQLHSRLRQQGYLSPEVWDKPGQNTKILSPEKTTKQRTRRKKGWDNLKGSQLWVPSSIYSYIKRWKKLHWHRLCLINPRLLASLCGEANLRMPIFTIQTWKQLSCKRDVVLRFWDCIRPVPYASKKPTATFGKATAESRAAKT